MLCFNKLTGEYKTEKNTFGINKILVCGSISLKPSLGTVYPGYMQGLIQL